MNKLEEANYKIKERAEEAIKEHGSIDNAIKKLKQELHAFEGAWSKYSSDCLAGCFRGDYSNHRHDMSCASIIATRLGMKYQRGGQHMAYLGPGYSQPEPGVVFHLQGVL